MESFCRGRTRRPVSWATYRCGDLRPGAPAETKAVSRASPREKRLEAICAEEFPGTDIGDVFAEHWPHPVLEEFVESMSLPVATEINIFNPDYVILGGGIIYMDQFPMETLLEEIKKKVRKPMPAENIRILFSKCKQETGVLGAAMYAVNKLNNQIV